MDPGEVPDKLQGLTEIEEMLIAQVFTVISVYWLHSEQYGYWAMSSIFHKIYENLRNAYHEHHRQ